MRLFTAVTGEWKIENTVIVKAQAVVVQTLNSAIHRINHYPVDSAMGFPNIYLAQVVQTLDSAIHRINHYSADKY